MGHSYGSDDAECSDKFAGQTIPHYPTLPIVHDDDSDPALIAVTAKEEDPQAWLLELLNDPGEQVQPHHSDDSFVYAPPAPAVATKVEQCGAISAAVLFGSSALQPDAAATQVVGSAEWPLDNGCIPMPGSHCMYRSSDEPMPVERSTPVLGEVRLMPKDIPLCLDPGVHYKLIRHPPREGLITRRHSPVFVAEHCLSVIRRVMGNFKIGVAIDVEERLELYKRDDGVSTLIALYHADTGVEAAELETTLISQFQLDERCRNIGRGGEGVGAMQGATWVYVAVGGRPRPQQTCLADKDWRWSCRKRKYM